jgi:hypothetical protein
MNYATDSFLYEEVLTFKTEVWLILGKWNEWKKIGQSFSF